MKKPKKSKKYNFWEDCGQKTKTEIQEILVKLLGEPQTDLEKGCLNALTKDITYFYSEAKDNRSKSISNVIGQVDEMVERVFGGKNKRCGQTYYSLKLSNGFSCRAIKEDLSEEKWHQIKNFEVLNQNFLFKYRNSVFGKDICDFTPLNSAPASKDPNFQFEEMTDSTRHRREQPSQLDN